MKDTQTKTGAAPSNAAGITLSSFMNLTHEERRDLLQAYHEAIRVCNIVMMASTLHPTMGAADSKHYCIRYSQGDMVAAKIAHDYLAYGDSTLLPSVPPEWYRAVADAQDARNTHE